VTKEGCDKCMASGTFPCHRSDDAPKLSDGEIDRLLCAMYKEGHDITHMALELKITGNKAGARISNMLKSGRLKMRKVKKCKSKK
jgi:hypothetical protein